MTGYARFFIDVPIDNIDFIEYDLENAGISGFSLIENMIHIPQNSIQNGIFTGYDGQYIVHAINRYLNRMNMKLQVPNDFRAMTPRARRDLLELATAHAKWSTGYGPSVLSIDTQTLLVFIAKHPSKEDSQPVKQTTRQSFRILRYPNPLPSFTHRATCPVPGCNHRTGYGPMSKYCWGHSVKDHVWDGLNWAPYHSALHGTECRSGKDGGTIGCSSEHVPTRQRVRYHKEVEAARAGTGPIPGP